MARLGEREWLGLMERIRDGRCTPFLGAGASYGAVPLGGQLASQWAAAEGYPLPDNTDLAKVAQFVAVMNDAMTPKERIKRAFETLSRPSFNEADEPHAVLAELPLPVYVTTNYDDFMVAALRQAQRDPKPELCRWNTFLQDESAGRDEAIAPTVASPLVYHLHGQSGIPESLVLTEDDYLDFLVRMSKNSALLPSRVRRAFAGSSLLFMGYRLADTNFRVLFRMLVEYLEKSLARSHVSVQLAPGPAGATPEERQRVEDYLDRYFGNLNIHVYWGDCRAFSAELRRRWREFNQAHAAAG